MADGADMVEIILDMVGIGNSLVINLVTGITICRRVLVAVGVAGQAL